MTVGQLSVGQKFFDQKAWSQAGSGSFKRRQKGLENRRTLSFKYQCGRDYKFYHPCNLHFTIIGERPFGQIAI
jgi:hypothetical protein